MNLKSIAGITIVFLATAAFAQALNQSLPGPAGLLACKADDPLAAQLASSLPPSGSLSGCFKSGELSQLRGASKPVSVPTETGFSITLSAPANGQFTDADLDQFFSKAQDQWKHVKPLWEQDKTSYERRVKQLLGNSTQEGAIVQDVSIDQPTLISMSRRSPHSYAVVDVRRMKVSTPDGKMERTVVDGTALILRDGELVRLTLLREFQKAEDIDLLTKEVDAWASRVENGG